VNFDEYLYSKKIDSQSFRQNEADLWESWKKEFDQISPVSFTAQKLYLINPIRRKYQLSIEPAFKKDVMAGSTASAETSAVLDKPQSEEDSNPNVSTPKVPTAKPVFRPKPKMS
jgi:hypothetical protein